MTEPYVVEFPPRTKWDVYPTFSIMGKDGFWLTSNGSRRAWSTRQAAELALLVGIRMGTTQAIYPLVRKRSG